MDFAERLELAIRCEAQLWIDKRIPLPERPNAKPELLARRDAYVEQFKAEYEAKNGTWSPVQIPWTSKQRKSIGFNLNSRLKLLADKFNFLPGEEDAWLDWAENLYEITDTFIVHSYAKVKGPNKSWQCASEADAEAKIGELLAYKIHDRLYKNVDATTDLTGVRELIAPY